MKKDHTHRTRRGFRAPHGAAQSGDRPAGHQGQVKDRQRHGYDRESRGEGKGAAACSAVGSFISVPPEDREDPIPHTNVFLGVLYVLGAVAALCFALIDSSCEEVTAYREDAPIDTCTRCSRRSLAAPRTTTGPPAPASPDFRQTTPGGQKRHRSIDITRSVRVNERACSLVRPRIRQHGSSRIALLTRTGTRLSSSRRTSSATLAPDVHTAVSGSRRASANTSNLFSTRNSSARRGLRRGPETEGAEQRVACVRFGQRHANSQHSVMEVTESVSSRRIWECY